MTPHKKLLECLDKSGFKYEARSHDPTPTCSDSARVRGTTEDQGAKALVCLVDKMPSIIVLPCSKKLDTKSFKRSFGKRDVRFATPEEVTNITGLVIGSIPPFGSLFGVPTYCDAALGHSQSIAFNSASLTDSVIISFGDYLQIEKPFMGQFSV